MPMKVGITIPTRRNTNLNMMRLVFSCGKCATGDGKLLASRRRMS